MSNDKKLCSEKLREIRQLRVVVQRYIALAKEKKNEFTKKELSQTVKAVTDKYLKGYPDEKTIELTILSAHLASAAVRLVTIHERAQSKFNGFLKIGHLVDEVLNSDSMLSYKEYNKLYYDKFEDEFRIKLQTNSSKLVHEILGNNIRHPERKIPIPNKNSAKDTHKAKKLEIRFKVRQDIIDDMKISDILAEMINIVANYEKELDKIVPKRSDHNQNNSEKE